MDGLEYEEDRRKTPSTGKRRNFVRGWNDAVRGETTYARVLHVLSWQNLGFRLGKIFGETEKDQILKLYDWAATQWWATKDAENERPGGVAEGPDREIPARPHAAKPTEEPTIDWEPSSFEDRLIYAYWLDVGGRIYLEVPLGGAGGDWPPASRLRRVDAVRLNDVAPGEEDIVPFAGRAEEFGELAEEKDVELIEVKRTPHRGVFGQVVAGVTMFRRHYGIEVCRAVALCEIPDPAMIWVFEEHGIAVELREPYPAAADG